MFWQIGYVSVAEGDWNQVRLSELEIQAASNNSSQGITGLLVFDGTHFFQYLEGERDQVESIYKKIQQDDRHSSVTMLSEGEVFERLFARWAMKLFLPENFNSEDRLHILDLLSQKHEKESIPQILGSLTINSEQAV
ncbi:MAG: BLUF domain-containing protein [Pseudomonadota bacterium]